MVNDQYELVTGWCNDAKTFHGDTSILDELIREKLHNSDRFLGWLQQDCWGILDSQTRYITYLALLYNANVQYVRAYRFQYNINILESE